MKKIMLIVAGLSLFISGCGFFGSGSGRGMNVFSVTQDKQLGAQLKDQIASNPSEYKILPYSGNERLYNFLYEMRDEILKSDEVKFKTEFNWELYIIDDKETLNAFCAPGGYMYVYTGLMLYLDKADHLAGVIGHEIAHADQRHSTQQMTKAYGLEAVSAIVTGGKSSRLAEMVKGLTSLSFSRTHEKDADDHSVDYLCDTKYAANGAAAFFEKLIAQGGSRTPAFLSTHPNPGNRVQAIKNRAQELKCITKLSNTNYAAIKKLIK
ncbi:MAG: M48 family metalloprotease [Saprospiraceae bacterium]|nr:M48 family metalloprotease [Saprospiraceae bacterium]